MDEGRTVLERTTRNARAHHGGVRCLGQTLAALVLTSALLAPTSLQTAIANGDTRAINLVHMHTKEAVSVTFRRDGTYDSAALKQLNWFLRDWRRDEPTKMDPRLFDVIWAAHREVGSSQPVHVLSAYRSPSTNAALRRRSRGVAKHSQHTLGKALDFYLPDVSVTRIREIGVRMQRGGVGYYPSSFTPFVHLDVGSVRAWPRLTKAQLARLFTDGRTVHIPSDGDPLPGYEVAKAEILARGGSVAGYAAYASSAESQPTRRRSLWAALFGGEDEEEDNAYYDPRRTRTAASRGAQQTQVASIAPASGSDDAGSRTFFVQPQTARPSERASTATSLPARQAPQPSTAPSTTTEPERPSIASARPAEGAPATPTPAVPLPVPRPRELAPFSGTTDVASLTRSPDAIVTSAIGFAPLPPLRPDGLTPGIEVVLQPLPPDRPASFSVERTQQATPDASLVIGHAADTQPLRLAAVNHPSPPARPAPEAQGIANAAVQRAQETVQVEHDRLGLRALFAAAAIPAAVQRAPVRTASTKVVKTAPDHSSASLASAGHISSKFEPIPSDASSRPGIGKFAGPAVAPLGTAGIILAR